MDVSVDKKNGVNVVRLHMGRCKDGIRIDVKLDQIIEDFFTKWSLGQRPEDVANYGRSWTPTRQEDSPLLVYPLPMDRIEPYKYTIWHPGRPLMWDQMTNISFLRLSGASRPEGVSFTVEDLVSKAELENLAEKVKRGCAWFYQEYIKPTDFDIHVEARERPRVSL